jgi:hypothetical protein
MYVAMYNRGEASQLEDLMSAVPGVKEKIRATMLARRKASEEELPPVRKKRVTAKPSTLSARAVPADRSSELEPAQLHAALTELKRLRDRLGNFLTR